MRRLLFRLALRLGCTVAELGDRMSSGELSEWMAFFQIEPLDDSFGHTALVCSTLNNLLGKKRTKPRDFDPRVDWVEVDADREMTRQATAFDSFAAAHNARESARCP